MTKPALSQPELPLWGRRDPEPAPQPGDALHRLVLDDRVIPYVLRRGRRRTIGLTIDHRGLRVGAPPRTSLGEIEAMIRSHAGWVLDKLDHWRTQTPPEAQRVVDGLRVPVMGQMVALQLNTGSPRVQWGGDCLSLALPAGWQPLPLLERALKARAREVFLPEVAEACGRLGVAVPPVALSNARTRWGSCSRLSGIRLNWRLIHFPRSIIDYVIAHEVAHLREMNHSPRFWAEVAVLCPDYHTARRQLRELAAGLPRFI